MLLVGDDAERKRLDFQSGTFLERKFLDKEVERVVIQTVKHDVCAYIGQMKMLGGEPGWGGDVVLVVSDVPVSDNERVDGQIQRLVRGCVFGCKGVEDKLEIGGCIGCGLVEVGLQAKQLCRGDGDATLCKGKIIELG